MRIDPRAVYGKFQKSDRVNTAKGDKGVSGSTYKEGDTLKGEIVDASQSKVSIRLSDGQTIEAKLASANTFSIGDTVAFVVKESGGEQLLLSPASDQGTQTLDQLLSILTEAGLAKTEANIDMVQQLMDEKMPVDQDSLKTMARLMKNYPETPLRQLIFLTKHQLPVTENNLNQLQMLENNEQPLMRSMASMVDDLSSALATKTATITSEQLPMMNDQEQVILASITEDSGVVGFQKEINRQIATTMDQMTYPQASTQMSGETQDSQAQGASLVPIADMLLRTDGERVGNDLVNDIKATVMKTDLTSEQTALLKALPEFEKMTLGDLSKLGDEGLISRQGLRTVLQDIKEGSTYQALAKGMLLSDLKVVEDGEIASYFKKVQEQVELFIGNTSEALEDSPVAKDAANVKASVEFLNTLQQDYNFMHLPMFLNDQLMHSELYVLNNQKAGKDKKASITALVRLDLKNLGHTDIYVKKTDKNLDIDFYMTDDQQMDVVRDQVFQLHKLLTSKGFNVLSASVKSLEKDFDIVEDFLGSTSEEHEQQRYTFDMRA